MTDNNPIPISILTVGDGDLSYSLALLRAYHPWIVVTPTTIVPSETDLVQTYANAKDNIQELNQTYNSSVLYNIDATHLERLMPNKYDLIVFNHPHLGDAELLVSKSETLHAQRHSILMAHYFYSAQYILKQPNGRIQLCLSGTQPTTWKVDEMASIHGLTRTHHHDKVLSTCSPPEYIFQHHFEIDTTKTIVPIPSKVQSHFKCPRKYRNGTLGSKTFLSKYGYRHRRTGGDLYMGNESDMKVFNSVILLYSKQKNVSNHHDHLKSWKEQQEHEYPCSICHVTFRSQDELQNHLLHPAMPDIMIPASFDAATAARTMFTSSLAGATTTTAITTPSVSKGGRVWKEMQPVKHSTISTVDSSKERIHKNIQENKLHGLPILPKNIIPIDKDMIEIQLRTPSEFHLKRFKWCCRQDTFELCKYIKSNKHLENVVKGGCILLNGHVIHDNGRILKEGDVITLLKSYKHLSLTMSHPQKQSVTTEDEFHDIEKHSFHTVRIVSELSTAHHNSKWIVAFKPVGCRSSGTFSSTTLEMIVQLMMERKTMDLNVQCKAISLLDTGCAGLCVLFTRPKDTKQDIIRDPNITYTFTALVHGLVPSDWDTSVYATISCRLRTFKRHGPMDHCGNDEENNYNVSKARQSLNDAFQITCKSRLNLQKDGIANVQLSTLSIQSTAYHGKLCNVICHTLRKLGFPVVNDRFCKRELSALPRIMRNILKKKICIGCYDLKIQEEEGKETNNITIDPHSRTQCSYWKDIMSPT